MHDIHNHHENHEHGQMSETEKLVKRVEHWIKHNDEHKKTYLEWAEKALKMNLKEVSDYLRNVAKLTDEQNDLFRKILKAL